MRAKCNSTLCILLPHVDEVDDYLTESAEVRAAKRKIYKKGFSQGDWALKAMIGASIPEWDKADEPKKYCFRFL